LGSRTRPQKIDRPKLLIVAGPNGSGKTTVFQNAVVEALGRTVWIINPDLLAERIRQVERLSLRAANLEAVRRIEKWLEASIDAHQTVGVETVLSTPKYRRLVVAAKKRQFDIALFYVLLNSPRLNVARVRLRVRKGGHDVPVTKILSRRIRSLHQFALVFERSRRRMAVRQLRGKAAAGRHQKGRDCRGGPIGSAGHQRRDRKITPSLS
jgi:predicted ABC-type ATPase